jgi:hypothetical protein
MDTIEAARATEFVSLREIAAMLGRSYWSASALAASGAMGTPVVIGRVYFFRRDLAERAVSRRLSERETKGRTTPITAAEA